VREDLRQLEVRPRRAQEQERRCEQRCARDCEPSIVAMLTKETSHLSPIGA
jgi:hypothetical protein